MYWQNFKQFWREQITHAAVSGFAGFCLAWRWESAPFGAAICYYVKNRQDLEFQKRHDSVGIDMAWHLGALITGGVVGLVLRFGWAGNG